MVKRRIYISLLSFCLCLILSAPVCCAEKVYTFVGIIVEDGIPYFFCTPLQCAHLVILELEDMPYAEIYIENDSDVESLCYIDEIPSEEYINQLLIYGNISYRNTHISGTNNITSGNTVIPGHGNISIGNEYIGGDNNVSSDNTIIQGDNNLYIGNKHIAGSNNEATGNTYYGKSNQVKIGETTEGQDNKVSHNKVYEGSQQASRRPQSSDNSGGLFIFCVLVIPALLKLVSYIIRNFVEPTKKTTIPPKITVSPMPESPTKPFPKAPLKPTPMPAPPPTIHHRVHKEKYNPPKAAHGFALIDNETIPDVSVEVSPKHNRVWINVSFSSYSKNYSYLLGNIPDLHIHDFVCVKAHDKYDGYKLKTKIVRVEYISYPGEYSAWARSPILGKADSRIVTLPNSNTFHYAWCHEIRDAKEIIVYKNETDAIKDGLKPCKHCRQKW